MLRPASIFTVVLLTALVAFGPVSTDLYLPAMPSLARALATDTARVQLTLSVFLAGYAVSQLVYGPLADRFGRRPVLLAGTALYALAGLACVAAPTVEALIGARFVQAVGACAGAVIARAVVRDVYGRERAAKVLAYMSTAMAMALLTAPMLGGYLVVWAGWRAVFVALAALGGLMLALVAFLLPETNPASADAAGPGAVTRSYRRLLGSPLFIGYALANGFVFSGLFVFVSAAPFVFIDHLGLSPHRFGVTFAGVIAGYICGNFLTGRLTLRLGLERMLGMGCGTAFAAGLAIAALALLGVDRVAALVAPMFVYLMGMGMVMPNAIAGAVGPFPHMAGAASALLGFLQMSMAGIAGAVVGHLDDGTQVPMAVMIAVMGACGMVVFAVLIGRRHAAPAGD